MKTVLEENTQLTGDLRRAEEDKEAAKRDCEKMLALTETMEQKLRDVGEELKAADLSSRLCTQSTTLASRVATALEQQAKLLDKRSDERDKFWAERTTQISERSKELDTRLEEFKKREGTLIRKNAQLLLVHSELEKENGDLRGRLEKHETELEKRDAVEIQQYSIADADEVDFPSPSSSGSARMTEPEAPNTSLTRRRVRFADETPGDDSDPSAESDTAESDKFYEWLMVDNYLDQKAQ
jgi:hypothetical protein